MDNKPDITEIYKEMFGGTEDGMPCFPYTECFANAEDVNMHIEQERLTRMLRSLIKVWPTRTLNLEVLEQLDEGATTIAKHNNKEIYFVKDGRVVRRYGCNANDYE